MALQGTVGARPVARSTETVLRGPGNISARREELQACSLKSCYYSLFLWLRQGVAGRYFGSAVKGGR